MTSHFDGKCRSLMSNFGLLDAINLLSKLALYEADYWDENNKIKEVAIFRSNDPETEERLTLLKSQLEGIEFCHTRIKSIENNTATTFDVVIQVTAN